jgi:nucleoside-diphosphate-sugar epimerase
MSPPRLFITGINGLIGSLLAEALSPSYDVYGLAGRGSFSERIFQADIHVYEQVAAAFGQAGPFRYLVHLAADARVEAEWASVLRNNIVGTRNVFEAARQFGVQRVVFASSNHVTGAYEGFPPNLHLQQEPPIISVQDPIAPDSDYGVSKAFGEAMARCYHERWGMAFICLRIGGVLRDDDPTRGARHRKIWLSHRDLVQLVQKSLTSDVQFGIYYGVSANRGAFWDISDAHCDLGYTPQDDASTR